MAKRYKIRHVLIGIAACAVTVAVTAGPVKAAAARPNIPKRVRLIIPMYIYDWHKHVPSPLSVSFRVLWLHHVATARLIRQNFPCLLRLGKVIRSTLRAYGKKDVQAVARLLVVPLPLKDVRDLVDWADTRLGSKGEYSIRAIIFTGRRAAAVIHLRGVLGGVHGAYTAAFFERRKDGTWGFYLQNAPIMLCACNAVSAFIKKPAEYPVLPSASPGEERLLVLGRPGHNAAYICFRGVRVNYLVPPVPTQRHVLIPKPVAAAVKFLGHAYRLRQQQKWTQYTKCFGSETQKHLVFGANPTAKQLTPKLVRFMSRMTPIPVRYAIYGRSLSFLYSPDWVGPGLYRFKHKISPIVRVVERMPSGKLLIVGRGFSGSFQQMEDSPQFYLPLIKHYLRWADKAWHSSSRAKTLPGGDGGKP